jgi:hypothetical protein
LVLGFVQNRLAPKLAASQEKLNGLQKALANDKSGRTQPELIERINRVANWHKRAGQVIAGADQILKMVAK